MKQNFTTRLVILACLLLLATGIAPAFAGAGIVDEQNGASINGDFGSIGAEPNFASITLVVLKDGTAQGTVMNNNTSASFNFAFNNSNSLLLFREEGMIEKFVEGGSIDLREQITSYKFASPLTEGIYSIKLIGPNLGLRTQMTVFIISDKERCGEILQNNVWCIDPTPTAEIIKAGEFHYAAGTTVVQYNIVNHGNENLLYSFSLTSNSNKGSIGELSLGTYDSLNSTSTNNTLNIQLLGYSRYIFSDNIAPQKKKIILVQVGTNEVIANYNISIEPVGFAIYTDSFEAGLCPKPNNRIDKNKK